MEKEAYIDKEIAGLRYKLRHHKLYNNIRTIDDLQVFMEYHVFAVWDFMSLLKALQQHLTTVVLPWVPSKNAKLSRFINEIVREEESDINENGEPKSHFEMYVDAMLQANANTCKIKHFIKLIEAGKSIGNALTSINLPESVANFVKFSFSVIETNQPHLIAAIFTYGREHILPDIFIEILKNTDSENKRYSKLNYYLNRHIELDGDEHGPLALEMIAELCKEDATKWNEVLFIAKTSLKKRIELWDTITDLIQNKKQNINQWYFI